MTTRTTTTVKTGWKAFFWMAVGELVVYASQHLDVFRVPEKYQDLLPFIGILLGIIGKMAASFVATEEA